ncbi:hypothetical protein DFJ74DRAFT_765296 [Hyaloraphidium curvatum]|nr:hypothetical protein DFJ74DRAFT_765296 [Hyaloraphidium curvatum]
MDSGGEDDDFYPRDRGSGLRGFGTGGRSLDFASGGIDRPDPSGIVRKDRGYGDRIAQYNEMDRTKDFGPGREGRGGGGGGGPRRGDDGPVPPLNSIQRGKVVRLEEYGAFVELQDFPRRHGMIHKSQLSKYKVDRPSDVLDIGDPVFAKVVSLDKDDSGRTKVALSLKYADQSKGTDLDPNGAQMASDLARRAGGNKGPWEPEPMRAEDAMRNATCRRCGGKGHIATECFSQLDRPQQAEEQDAGSGSEMGGGVEMRPAPAPKPGYKQYDLVASDDEADVAAQQAIERARKKKEDKERKRRLLEKLERGEKVEPADMDEALLLLKKKKRKEKKEAKKRKASSSSSSSDSERDRRKRKDKKSKGDRQGPG